MNFADTNWLASVYLEPRADDGEAVRRRQIVERFLRRHGGQLVYPGLEAAEKQLLARLKRR